MGGSELGRNLSVRPVISVALSAKWNNRKVATCMVAVPFDKRFAPDNGKLKLLAHENSISCQLRIR